MVMWRSRSPLRNTNSPVQSARKKKRERKRFLPRSLRLEPFEQRTLFAIGPQLIAVIPNEGAIIQDDQLLHIGPKELMFRFDEGQEIDPNTLSAIQITRSGGDNIFGNKNDVSVGLGFVGLGENPNEVVLRFSQTLPDDLYQIRIVGAGAAPLRNTEGDAFNNGSDLTRTFDLDLGALVVSVVPQPVTRNGSGVLQQATDEIHVYFNDDDLGASATNKAFYQLIRTAETATNLDDSTPINPISVVYDATADRALLKFAPGVLETAGTYRLRIGNSDPLPARPKATIAISDAPVMLFEGDSGTRDAIFVVTLSEPSNQVVTVRYTTAAGTSSIAAENAQPNSDFQPLTQSLTFNPGETSKTIIVKVNGDVSDEGNESFLVNLSQPTGGTVIANAQGRGVIIDDEGVVSVPTIGDPGSSFSTANTLVNAFTSGPGLQSVVISSAIEAQQFALLFPGGNDEPGHRDIIAENHLLGAADINGGAPTIFYNFRSDYGSDPFGNPLFNLITEAQKQRSREIFAFFSYYTGVQFVETERDGLILATGDIRAVDPEAVSGPGGILGIAGGGLFVIDNAENWGESEPGGAYFQTAMHEVGHLLGLGHTYDLPDLTIQGSSNVTTGEPVFPGDHDLVHLQHVLRPDVKDIDLYQFTLPQTGKLNIETIAERLPDSSLLDTVISVYDASRKLIARNDNSFSKDSFLELQLDAGVYYVAVTSTGNTDFDPTIADSGLGGTSEGVYKLRLNFTSTASIGMADATGTQLDGDADGLAGGTFNFWFKTQTAANTIWVDKAATGGTGQLGSRTNPYTNIATALGAASQGKIVRIVGNGGADGNIATLADNLTYNVGVDILNTPLSDGTKMEVPQGVTVMIDAGAIFRMRAANIDVGTSAQGVLRNQGALQVLGTPQSNVLFTSYHNQAIGKDLDPRATTPAKGDWGGLVFRADSDLELQGIFLNHVNHAQLTYGGGAVVVNGEPLVFNPIHINEARPTVTFNVITNSADAAMSADPNSFEETKFQDYMFETAGQAYAADYDRVGPDVHGNMVFDNSLNGLFVGIRTESLQSRERLEVQARFDDTDIVHIVPENLVLAGTPGGPVLDPVTGELIARLDARLTIDPGMIVKLDNARIEMQMGAQLIAEGTAGNRVIFTSWLDDRFGAGGTFDTTGDGNSSAPAEGEWAGILFGYLSSGSIDHALVTFGGGGSAIEGGFREFNTIEIHQSKVRIANSTIERSADGVEVNEGGNVIVDDRNGRGPNAAATIFVRGAQPVILNNILRNNQGAAININANALNSDRVDDWGHTNGRLNVAGQFMTNFGPLVEGNRLLNNAVNGMLVRGGVLTTQSVWDDTDIVHVVQEEIASPDFHTFGGLRLQSSATASLVVKLKGATAGITASGRPLDINDRIGGSVQIIGTPGHPVVLTSISDDTVGAGLDPSGRPVLDTDNNAPEEGEGDGQLPTIPEQDRGTLIDNDTETSVVGHFEARIGNGGDVTQSGATGQGRSQVFENEDWIFDFSYFVDVGGNGGAIDLKNTTITMPATLISPDRVASEGTFAGANGLVRWRIESFLENGSPSLQSSISFTSDQPLGNLRFINYLDEDVQGISDDIMWLSGTPGQPDFQVFTLDNPERIGFSQGGVYVAGTGLENATWDGWAADQYDELEADIVGAGHAYSVPGVIDTTDLRPFLDPVLGQVYGTNDITTAFAWSVIPTATKATITAGLGFIPESPIPAAGAGDWRSVKLGNFSNDRNVDVASELERSFSAAGDTNNVPALGQYLGSLAPDEKSGDDNLRLGFEVHGAIIQPSDVDVYSFRARTGTDVWLDIDRTHNSLDSVIELVDAQGSVIARSDNSAAEAQNAGLLVGSARTLVRGSFSPIDNYSTNPLDAGMRVVLPGTAGASNLYYVRIRSKSNDLTNLTAGQTKGAYQLQIRLREADEVPGSAVRYADIRYATNGLEILGKPGSSPLLGEAVEKDTASPANEGINKAQDLGNLLTTNRGTLAVAGSLLSATDVDWYKFNLQYDLIQFIGLNHKEKTFAAMFDIDYADGMGRPDTTLSVFDQSGNLILIGRDSDLTDDQPGPAAGADTTDLTRGSFGKLDPAIGSVHLPEGTTRTYYVAVSSNKSLPTILNATFKKEAADPLVRLEPVSSIRRIGEDHLESEGDGTGLAPLFDLFQGGPGDIASLNLNANPFQLGDVVMYAITNTDLFTVNPLTGKYVSDITGDLVDKLPGVGEKFPTGYADLIMRSDGRLYSLTLGDKDGSSGNYNQFSPADASLITSSDDLIGTWDFAGPGAFKPLDLGVQFQGMTIVGDGNKSVVYAVGNRGDFPGNPPGINVDNLLFRLNGDTGQVIDYVNKDKSPAVPTDALVTEFLAAITAKDTIEAVRATDLLDSTKDIVDGMTITIDSEGGPLTFEFDSGPEVTVGPQGGFEVRDGDTFTIDGPINDIANPGQFLNQDITFEFDSGRVLEVLDPALIADGATLILKEGGGLGRTVVLEFNKTGGVQGLNRPVAVLATDTPATLAARIVAVVNGANLLVDASVTPGGSRVSFTGDEADELDPGLKFGGASPLTIAGAKIDGKYGLDTAGAAPVDYDESDTTSQLGQRIENAVNNQAAELDIEAGSARNRVTFFRDPDSPLGPVVISPVTFAIQPAFTIRSGPATGVVSGNVVVEFHADDSAFTIAQTLAQAINDANTIDDPAIEEPNDSPNNQERPPFNAIAFWDLGTRIELDNLDPTPPGDPPTGDIDDADPIENNSTLTTIPANVQSNGTVTGIAFIEGTLFAVDDTGQFFRVAFGAGRGRNLVPLADVTGISFTGLREGPQNAAGGDLADLVFATGVDTSGDEFIFAINSDGELQPVFNGQDRVEITGVPGQVQGIAFSPIDYNLWHVTKQRTKDAGHEAENSFDFQGERQFSPTTNLSFYFGLEDPLGAIRPVSNQPGAGAFKSNNTVYQSYDVPGGAHGSLSTNPFSLLGYAATDKPTLYFDYFLESQERDSTDKSGDGAESMLDSLRVQISNDGITWSQLATNNSKLTLLAPREEAELPANITASGGLYRNDELGTQQAVQELFDNTGGWRQARIDLGDFAGLENLIVRFDFATAGSMDQGIPGDQFGVKPFAPNDAARGQNNNFEGAFIDGIIIGFAERGEMVTGHFQPVDLPFLDLEAEPAITGNTGFFGTPQNPIGGGSAEVSTGAYQLEIRRAEEYSTNDSLLSWGLEFQQTFDTNDRLAQGFTLIVPAGSELSDGAVIRIHDGLTQLTFEFDSDVPASIGSGRIRIPFSNTMTSFQVAQSIRTAINGTSFKVRAGGNATTNRVDLAGAQNVDVGQLNIVSERLRLEVNDTIATAISSGLSSATPGKVTLKGALGDKTLEQFAPFASQTSFESFRAADVDFVSFQLSAGDTVRIDVNADPALASAGTLVRVFKLDTLFDPTDEDHDVKYPQVAISDDSTLDGTTPGAPGEDVGTEAYLEFTAEEDGIYWAGISSLVTPFNGASALYQADIAAYAAGVVFDPAFTPPRAVRPRAGDPGSFGDYEVDISIGAVEVIRNDLVGDSGATQRDQGQTLIQGVSISNSAEWGIRVQTGHEAGGVRNLRELNTQRLVSGITLVNNLIYGSGEGGIKFEGTLGDLLTMTAPTGSAITDGQTFTVTSPDGTVTFEFDNQTPTSVVAGNVAIKFATNQTAAQVATSIRNAINANATLNVAASGTGGAVDLRGADSVTGLAVTKNADPTTAAVFGRILNNTIYGTEDVSGTGIDVSAGASPTILNNILANLAVGVQIDTTSSGTTTVLGSNLYQGNTTNRVGGVAELNAITLAPSDPLFIDAPKGNFYLKTGSKAIDSSLKSLEERPALKSVGAPLAIPESPILAPELDLLGQLRVDDPSSGLPPGTGAAVFLDRGAIDRSDFTGPTAVLVTPADNDGVRDQNPALNQVSIAGQSVTNLSIQLRDDSGSGIDDSLATLDRFTLRRNGVVLQPITDFIFSYDPTSNTVRFEAAAGVWVDGNYTITLDNTAETGLRDLAANSLRPNEGSGGTSFLVSINANPTSPWQNPNNPLDVDGGGFVSGLDALNIINALNDGLQGPLPVVATPPPYYDVNGDGLLTPLDALIIINFLNNQSASQASAASAPVVASAVSAPMEPAFSSAEIFVMPAFGGAASAGSGSINEAVAFGLAADATASEAITQLARSTAFESALSELNVSLTADEVDVAPTIGDMIRPLYDPHQWFSENEAKDLLDDELLDELAAEVLSGAGVDFGRFAS